MELSFLIKTYNYKLSQSQIKKKKFVKSKWARMSTNIAESIR